MKTLFALTATALLCFATGCASRPEAFVPMAELTPETEFELNYSGGIGATSTLEDLPEWETYGGDTDFMYMLEVRFLSAKPEEARRMFGDRAIEIGAWSLPAGEVTEELLSKATLVSAPRMSVFEGQTGTIVIVNEMAYISGFEVQGKEATRIADPIVDTILDGLFVELQAVSVDDDKLSLSAGVTLSEVVRPIRTQKIRLYGADVEIQVPVAYTQRIKAAGEISEDRVLVLTGMLGRDNDIYTVLISGQRVPLDEATPEEPEDGTPEDPAEEPSDD